MFCPGQLSIAPLHKAFALAIPEHASLAAAALRDEAPGTIDACAESEGNITEIMHESS